MHMAQLMPLPLTLSCFSKIQIGITFLVPAHPGSPGQRAVKRACVCSSAASRCLTLSLYTMDANCSPGTKSAVYACRVPALLWTAPELMASQLAGVIGMSTGTQKGDVYSFGVIVHEILYRAGLFRCCEDQETMPAKSTSTDQSTSHELLEWYWSSQ